MPPVSTSDLLQSFQQGQARQPDLGNAVAQGFEFAKSAADLKLRKAQLEQRKKENERLQGEQAIRTGDAVLDRMVRLKDTKDKSARKVIGSQIVRLSQSQGFEMDEATLKEMENDTDEKFTSITSRMQKLIEVAPDNLKQIMRASLAETIATQPLSVTAKKLDSFEQQIAAEPAREAAQKIEERKAKVGERQAAVAEATLDFRKKELDAEVDLKKKELQQEAELAKTEAQRKAAEASGKELDFISKSKPFTNYTETSISAREVVNALDSDSPFGTLKATFKFLKALDPESVVRGSEIEGFQGTGAIGTRIAAYLNNLKEGNALKAEAIKDDLKLQIRDTLQNSMEGYARFVEGRRPLAKSRSLEKFDPGTRFLKDDINFINTLGGFRKKKGKSALKERADSQGVNFKQGPDTALLPKQLTTFKKLQDKVASGRATPRERALIRELRTEIAKQRQGR